jgi:hypothetical protein
MHRFAGSARRCAISVAFAALSLLASAQSPWKVVELRGPEGTFVARAFTVDRNRNVYGQAQMSVGGIRPVRWMAATGYKPEFVGTQDGYIRGANGRGFFTGMHEMTVAGPQSRPVIWAPDGTFQYLEGLPEFRRAEGISINQVNMVAGSMITQDFGWRAFRWHEGQGLLIPMLGDYPYAVGTGLSDSGFVVGYGMDNYNPPTKMAGWFWSPTGGLQKLPPVGAFYRANGLNNTGLVCGFARLSGIGTAVLWPIFGAPVLLPAPTGFTHGEAVGVNDAGDVVGNIWGGKWNDRIDQRPVVWAHGDCHNIAAEAASPGLRLARGINFRGDVVGEGVFEGRNSGFIALRKL